MHPNNNILGTTLLLLVWALTVTTSMTQFLLFNQARALDEWGLVHGARFTCIDCCDALRELFLYATRKRFNEWTVYLVNRRDVSPGQELTLFVRTTDPFEIEWRIGESGVHHHEQRMLKALSIGFTENTSLQITVMYITCCSTLEGLYWMNVNDWYARCKTVQECTTFFNAVSSNIHTIESVLERNMHCRGMFLFLSEEVLRKQEEEDPIRLASMRRKMNLMKQDVISVIHLGIPHGRGRRGETLSSL